MLFKVFVFVCAAGLPPQSCDDSTAIHHFMAEPTTNPMMCGFNAQAQLAETSLNASSATYMKVVCKRQKPITAAIKLH
jgi:hypothetical protein